MTALVHDLIFSAAARHPAAEALVDGALRLDYAALAGQVRRARQLLLEAGIGPGERVAIYLEKRVENVAAMFAAAAAGAVFVPVNPLLKAEQVAHILDDCQVAMLLTSSERIEALRPVLARSASVRTVFLCGRAAHLPTLPSLPGKTVRDWAATPAHASHAHRRIDADVAAILYTSGSTGKPKGVVLSHRNLVAGADSVAAYLGLNGADRILAVLPLSFDYGLNQLTAAFQSGAAVVLMNYLLPRDIVAAVAAERITGLAAVPPLWSQLAALSWPQPCSLRYLTNSGGTLPPSVALALRAALPGAALYLMYGLTEAFRSTYLPPEELERRPGSIGRAIPNAEILVVRPDGSLCDDEEVGELVHRGALVALGYWNDPAKTAERFRPAPGRDPALPLAEMAVWSGDRVRRDREGYLYFVGRDDAMIKVSGYRISPSEIEEVIDAAGVAEEAIAFGVPHPHSGQALVVLAVAAGEAEVVAAALTAACRRALPAYMVPAHVAVVAETLPRTPNGKIDRVRLQGAYLTLFESPTAP